MGFQEWYGRQSNYEVWYDGNVSPRTPSFHCHSSHDRPQHPDGTVGSGPDGVVSGVFVGTTPCLRPDRRGVVRTRSKRRNLSSVSPLQGDKSQNLDSLFLTVVIIPCSTYVPNGISPVLLSPDALPGPTPAHFILTGPGDNWFCLVYPPPPLDHIIYGTEDYHSLVTSILVPVRPQPVRTELRSETVNWSDLESSYPSSMDGELHRPSLLYCVFRARGPDHIRHESVHSTMITPFLA